MGNPKPAIDQQVFIEHNLDPAMIVTNPAEFMAKAILAGQEILERLDAAKEVANKTGATGAFRKASLEDESAKSEAVAALDMFSDLIVTAATKNPHILAHVVDLVKNVAKRLNQEIEGYEALHDNLVKAEAESKKEIHQEYIAFRAAVEAVRPVAEMMSGRKFVPLPAKSGNYGDSDNGNNSYTVAQFNAAFQNLVFRIDDEMIPAGTPWIYVAKQLGYKVFGAERVNLSDVMEAVEKQMEIKIKDFVKGNEEVVGEVNGHYVEIRPVDNLDRKA